jgi:hypothetical protein
LEPSELAQAGGGVLLLLQRLQSSLARARRETVHRRLARAAVLLALELRLLLLLLRAALPTKSHPLATVHPSGGASTARFALASTGTCENRATRPANEAIVRTSARRSARPSRRTGGGSRRRVAVQSALGTAALGI